jgi:hypothetical protein
MTYEALARGANGLFYFSFDDARKLPATWEALKAVAKEVNECLPLFQARPLWWAKNHHFGDPALRYNQALESSVTSTLLRVSVGNDLVPCGDYILAVNNTERRHQYSFELPHSQPSTLHHRALPVHGEGRAIQPNQNRLQDEFGPYAVHVYGPLP